MSIQDLDGSIALNKGSVLALRKICLLKLNSSKHITSMELTEVIDNDDSL